MADEPTVIVALAALTSLVLDLYVHQKAMKPLLQLAGVTDEQIQAEVAKIHTEMSRHPLMRDFRSQMTPAKLVTLEKVLRGTL